MLRSIVVVGCLLFGSLLFPRTVEGQTPNPKGFDETFVAGSAGQENTFIISLRQVTTGRRVRTAKFISNFTASDSCRVVFHNVGTDDKFKSNNLADIEISNIAAGVSTDAHVLDYIPMALDEKYNWFIDADYMIIYHYGTHAGIRLTGTVEYE